MMNTYTYNPPHLSEGTANLWLNLDPNTITDNSGAVSKWKDNMSGIEFTMRLLLTLKKSMSMKH